MKSDTTSTTESVVGVAHPRLVRPLEVGCVVTTNGGKKHTIAEIGFGGSEGVAENCFYHWDKDWPYEIEHAAMDPDRDTIVSVSWPTSKRIYRRRWTPLRERTLSPVRSRVLFTVFRITNQLRIKMKTMEIDPQYTNQNSNLKGFDLEAMADLGAHSDGSGGGIRQLAWEMGKLSELRQRIALLDAFVRKYQLILARLSWDLSDTRIHPTKKQGEEKDIGVFVPEIDLYSSAYDKRRDVTAKDIAALWPDAQWRRSMPRYSCDEDTVRDYTADIDGVLVRITNAERKPKPKKVDTFGACGPLRISPVNIVIE